MKIGMSLSSSIQGETPQAGAEWIIERAQAADRVGLDSLSLGDHHAMASSYYQNTPMLGRLMAEWGDRPIGCLFLLPLWHPVLVAEHIGTLASLTRAPFIVQTGIGFGEGQFAALNADHGTRGRVLEESVRVVKAVLAGEPVESDLVGGPVEIGLRPAQTVEWWIGGGPSSKAIRRAARIGDAWYASPAVDVASARTQLGVYLEHCEAFDRVPRALVRKDVVVLEAPGEGRRVGAEIVEAGYRGLGPEALLMGSPEEVAAQLRPLSDAGFSEVICRCMSSDQAQAVETIELLAEVRDLLD
ncbi:MAG: LLM class flavin-dependent oxidoreductase [Acidimicrobiales bacterium]